MTPGGGTLIFSYIRRLRSLLGVQNFKFQYFWEVSEKLIFLGYEDYVDIFGGSSQNWTNYFRVISMHFRGFLKVKVQNGGYIFHRDVKR